MKRLLSLVTLLVCGEGFAQDQEWRFRVYLDDREIGHHEFVLDQQGTQRRLTSSADFEYRLLFVTLYEYRHRNTETWEGDCLSAVEASTDANGERYEVRGEAAEQGFVLQQAGETVALPRCLMSFAYWNPDFIGQQHLLNTQNGELVEVEFGEPEPDLLTVRGEAVNALKYRLQAGDMNIRLWYSNDRDWLALETDARGGRVLRYELL